MILAIYFQNGVSLMHSFHYHCDRFDRDVEVTDWLIPNDELESAGQMAGINVTCIHCGNQHGLFVVNRESSEQIKAFPASPGKKGVPQRVA